MRVLSLILIVSFFIYAGCRKKEKEQVPYVRVNFSIYLTDPLYVNLQANGGHIYYSAGSRGVIIYRRSNDEFKAYERHCPYNVTSPCGTVSVEASGLTATDTCCGSVFSITDGTVIKGPATSPLKQYRVYLDGNRIDVSN